MDENDENEENKKEKRGREVPLQNERNSAPAPLYRSVNAVSYTHLDVYKRQAQHQAWPLEQNKKHGRKLVPHQVRGCHCGGASK